MKRKGRLFEKITDLSNILAAHQMARRGKAHYKEVQMVNLSPEYYCGYIQRTLQHKTFTTSEYRVETKHDGRKVREIYKLPYFPDRIVQHALLQVCVPIWQPRFIRDTYQSVIGRGTHDARKRVEKAVKNQPPQYALKFDIQKYYPSINNEILKDIIRESIKCTDTLWLIDDIIDSSRGIPIGNYTSQYFGNLYLTPFDWWVKQTIGVKHYFRYCDDIVVLGPSKQYCHEVREKLFEKLNEDYLLAIKDNWQVFPVEDRGLDFVGYVFRSDSTRVRKNIAKGFKDKAKAVKRIPMGQSQAMSGLMSYWGWCKHANAKKLWMNHVDGRIISVTDSYGTKRNPLREIMQ